MLKYGLLAGAMTMAIPALAQTAPTQSMTPQTAQTAPATPDATAPQSAPASDSVVPAQDGATASQTAAPTQVADIVTKEFPSYDKNGDGNLSAAEFDAWMVALKTANDPSTKATSPATKTWLNQAFAQADSDKNKKVSQSELTGFLSQKG